VSSHYWISATQRVSLHGLLVGGTGF